MITKKAGPEAAPLMARGLTADHTQTQIAADGRFSGYASVFSIKDTGGDIVEPGAFAKSLQGRKPSDIRLLWQHDPREPIGVITSVREDQKGLLVEGKLLLEIERAKALHLLVQAGALDALSIGYKVRKSYSDQAARARRIAQVDLWEVSFVTFPMQPLARLVQVKTLPQSIRDYEAFLRDAGGFSRKQAAQLAAKGFSALHQPFPAAGSGDWGDVLASVQSLTDAFTPTPS